MKLCSSNTFPRRVLLPSSRPRPLRHQLFPVAVLSPPQRITGDQSRAQSFTQWFGMGRKKSRGHSSSSTRTMASKNYNSIPAFHKKLLQSKRILAVCGAGLSAASGLPTFRGAGGLWRNHNATDLATPRAFAADPGLVWLFYAYRRHMALKVKPNPGHHALAALANKNPDFMCLSQNVDNLHGRANHPPSQLRLLHASLFDIKCSNCSWIERNNTADPFCPALSAASEDVAPGETLPLLDPKHKLAHIPASDLPKCPECKTGLQRPGVVWFDEALDSDMLEEIEEWIYQGPVDIVLVVGTSSVVWPAAGYAEMARTEGHTSVVTVNLDAELKHNLEEMQEEDFAFGGDAAVLLPALLEPLIGKLEITE